MHPTTVIIVTKQMYALMPEWLGDSHQIQSSMSMLPALPNQLLLFTKL